MASFKPVQFGPYLMLERLAIGGMAEVWLAKQRPGTAQEKLVALKRILPSISEDQEFISMFNDEARIAGQLAHANIAQIFDVGKIGQSYYIALEYIPGIDLRTLWDRVRGRGGFPLAVACHIVARICEGLDYAHRRKDNKGRPLGIVHRDVSPQNVLISYDGDVKIIDFGIAKAANRAVRTQTGILKGKFAYMAPEQARGMPMDHRADVFAIGVILHELITGERTFRAESDFSLLEKVRNAEVETPRTSRPDTPPDLEKVVMKALAARPEDRYPWGSSLASDLERFMVSSRRSCSRDDLSGFLKDHFSDRFREDMEREKEAMRVTLENSRDDSVVVRPPAADGTKVITDNVGGEYPTNEVSQTGDHSADEHTMIQDDATQDVADREPEPQPAPGDDLFSEAAHTKDVRRGKGPKARAQAEEEAAMDAAISGATVMGDAPSDAMPDEEPARPKKKLIRLEEADLDNELAPRTASPRRVTVPGQAAARALPALDDSFEGNNVKPTAERPAALKKLPTSMADVAGPHSDPSQVSRRQAAHEAKLNSSDDEDGPSNATNPREEAPPHRLPAGLIAGAGVGGVLLGMLLLLLLQSTSILGRGTLVVMTGKEQAQIQVDDRTLPGGSYAVEQVPAGTHKVTITLEGFQPDIQQVEIPPGGFAAVKLTQRNARGSLFIDSVPPGASVFINDTRRPGQTPMTVEDLDPGVTYTVTLRHPDATQDTAQVATQAGEVFKHKRRLRLHNVRVTVDPTPEDAAVSVDGAFKGRGKNMVKVLKTGSRASIKVFRPGCTGESIDVGANGEDIEKKVELTCKPLNATISVLEPEGARVRIDDLDTGLEVPVQRYKLPAGRHSFELTGGRKVHKWQENIDEGHTTLRPD